MSKFCANFLKHYFYIDVNVENKNMKGKCVMTGIQSSLGYKGIVGNPIQPKTNADVLKD